MKLPLLFTILLLSFSPARAGEPLQPPARVPVLIELRDQYDAPQKLSFPTTNVVVLTIADRKGSEQIDDWIAALKTRYVGRIDIRGLADCGGAPALLRGRIRKKFRETRAHPVMMDWSGEVCARFGYKQNAANVLVIGRDGGVLARHSGAASPSAVADVCAALDKALSPVFSGRNDSAGHGDLNAKARRRGDAE